VRQNWHGIPDEAAGDEKEVVGKEIWLEINGLTNKSKKKTEKSGNEKKGDIPDRPPTTAGEPSTATDNPKRTSVGVFVETGAGVVS